ncbi:MAG: hypothetical protein EOP04_02965 [Proteobacteria bacterium]|nr:MAG: hypothetical protein EOP04_02965 [Pseudomonadota bacterium]
MKAQKRETERPRIDVSPNAIGIIDDLIERGHFESVRAIIDAALPLLQLKLVNDTQGFADLYEDVEAMNEMTMLQLKDSPA